MDTAPPISHAAVPAGSDARYAHDRYVIKRQFAKLLGAALRVYANDERLLMYVEQKAFKLKEDVRVYSDESKTTELMSVKARKVMDFAATYDVVETATGLTVGSFQRKGWKSMLRDEWSILDVAGNQVGRIIEDQGFLAIVRRIIEFGGLIPQSYDIELNGLKVADYKQRFNPFLYHMDLDLTPDPSRKFDRRLALAAGILLALVEGRQG